MAEEIGFKNGRISNFEGLVTFTLDRVILHTIVLRASLVDLYLQAKKLKKLCGLTYGRTFETGFIRSSKIRPKSPGAYA